MPKIRVTTFLIGLWTLTLLCFRPSVFGEKYNAIVFIIFVFSTLLILLFNQKRLFTAQKHSVSNYFLILILAGYLFIQGTLSGASFNTVFNSCFLIIFVSLFVLLIANKYKTEVLKAFIFIHFYLSLSSIVTTLIFILSGFNEDSLPVVLNLNNFVGREQSVFDELFANHYVYFPFSHSWASVGFAGISVPRLIGLYREAGMAQIFFFTAYFLTYLVPVKRLKLMRIVLLVGGILTFSTSGLLSFSIGFIMLHYLPSWRLRLSIDRVLVFFFVIPAIVAAALFLPDIGIMNKVSSLSGDQRTQSYLYSVNKFAERPLFGHGYYKGFEQMELQGQEYVQFLGIIGVLYQIGLIGIILYLLPWIYSLYYLNNRKTYFVLMPCLITLLFSQPSYNDVFVWFLLLIDFKSLVTRPLDTASNLEPGLSATERV